MTIIADDRVQITKTFRDDHWVVQAEVLQTANAVLPHAVFIHENNGGAQLGRYVGVCGFEELDRLQVWAGQPIPVFANRYVRTNQVEHHLTPGTSPDRTVELIRKGLSDLRQALLDGQQISVVYPVS